MRISLKARLAMAFATVVLMGVASTAVTFYQLSQISQVQEEIKARRVPLALSAERVRGAISDAGFQFRNYILYGDDPQLAAKYDGLRQAAWKRLFDEIAKMRELAQGDDQKILAELEDHARNGSLQIQIDTLPDFGGHGPEARARGLERMKAGAGLAARVQADCLALTDSVQQALERDNQRLSELQRTARTTLLALLGVMSLVASGMGWLLSREIAAFVHRLSRRMGEITSGDLRGEPLPSDTGDEIALVFSSVNAMQQQLKETIAAVAHGAERVASASEQLSSSAGQIAHSAETQKDQAAQVAASMQDMASTVGEVNEASHRARDNARAAGELARTGGQIVSGTVAMIEELANSTRETAEKIQALGRSGDQIGIIIGVIDDIADQTNLLALNA